MQFGLRDLIITVTIVAVLSAAIAPRLRSLDVESQKNFAIRLGLFLAGVLLALLLFCPVAVFSRARRGPCRLTVSADAPRWKSYLRWGIGTILVILYFGLATGTLLLSRKIRLDSSSIILSTMWGALSLQHWILIRRLTPRFEIFDQGIATGFSMLQPWTTFRSYCWTHTGSRLVLQAKGKFNRVSDVSISVPPEQRDEVNRVIGQFLNEDVEADAKRQ